MSAVQDLLNAVPKVSSRGRIRSLPLVAAIGIGFSAYSGGIATIKLIGIDQPCRIGSVSQLMSSDELEQHLADIDRKLGGSELARMLVETDRELRSIDVKSLPSVFPSLAIDVHGLGRVEGQ